MMVMKRNKWVHQCQMRHFLGWFFFKSILLFVCYYDHNNWKMSACCNISKILVKNMSGISLKTPWFLIKNIFLWPLDFQFIWFTIMSPLGGLTTHFPLHHNDLELSKQSLKKRDLYHFMNFSTENICVSFISQVIRVIL